uniref:Endonuclease/exonuclease/phosphatase domain-containing protein n=1 Tax=Latimeria chalumnae TaxID=7897 RepID=H3AJ77_LATCH
ICQLNVEGLSRAKCNYLSKLLTNNTIDVLALQETHVSSDDQARRYKINGYKLASSLQHPNQHKPVIIHVGIEIPVMVVKRVPRWNLGKAAWDSFEAKVEKTISRIPPTPKNYDRFVALLISAGKNNIPCGHRKGYIPCWTPNCENLLRQYEQSEDPAAASALLDTLGAARHQRWIECMESLDFTHSSRRAWGLLRKLGAANPVVAPDVKVKPNTIAAYLVANSKGPLNKQYKQEVKRQLRKVMTACPESSALSTHFSSEELATALTATKKGKATGKDGIPPDFLHHLGPRVRK